MNHPGGAPVQRGYFRGQRAAQFQPEQISEQVVVAEPGASGVERFDERVGVLEVQQDLFRARAAGQQVGQLAVDGVEQGGAQQQILDVGRLAVEHFGEQVLGDHAVAAGELGDEPLRVGVPDQGEGREPQARSPSLGPLVQQRRPGRGQRDARGFEQLAGFALGKAQVRRADLGQLAGQPQPVQPQPHIVTRGQDRVHVRGKAGQQPGELSGGLWRAQLVKIINNQRDAAMSAGELREHPVDHRRCVEVGCRCWRFATVGRGRSVTDRVEQGQPELLGVLLAALHLHEGEPARLIRQASPGAQQRRLPAPGRGRDDRHLARRRAIQGSEKITPVDQPGSCWSHRQRPALISTPDNPGAGHTAPAPSPRYQASARTVNDARTPFCRAVIHAPPRSHPVRRCPGAADHLDPVTTSHLPRSNPGSADRIAREMLR